MCCGTRRSPNAAEYLRKLEQQVAYEQRTTPTTLNRLGHVKQKLEKDYPRKLDQEDDAALPRSWVGSKRSRGMSPLRDQSRRHREGAKRTSGWLWAIPTFQRSPSPFTQLPLFDRNTKAFMPQLAHFMLERPTDTDAFSTLPPTQRRGSPSSGAAEDDQPSDPVQHAVVS